jgi:hypothetical protein
MRALAGWSSEGLFLGLKGPNRSLQFNQDPGPGQLKEAVFSTIKAVLIRAGLERGHV